MVVVIRSQLSSEKADLGLGSFIHWTAEETNQIPMINMEDVFMGEAMADFETYINTSPALEMPLGYFPPRSVEGAIPGVVDGSGRGVDRATDQGGQTNEGTGVEAQTGRTADRGTQTDRGVERGSQTDRSTDRGTQTDRGGRGTDRGTEQAVGRATYRLEGSWSREETEGLGSSTSRLDKTTFTDLLSVSWIRLSDAERTVLEELKQKKVSTVVGAIQQILG